jgi:uncharacterized protein
MGKRGIIFLILTLSLTWVLWWALSYLTRVGAIAFQSAIGQVLFIIGGSGPTIGAYVAVIKTKDKGSLKEFHLRVFKYRVKVWFYLFALLVPVILGICGIGIVSLINQEYLLDKTFQPIVYFIPAFFIGIVMGGIEEFGWRGVFQHELNNKLILFVTNIIIGIVWAIWHLPLFYIEGSSHQGGSFLYFALSAVGYSSFLTWLYAKTNSVLLCVIFHASINATASAALSVSIQDTSVYPFYALFVFIAGLVFIILTERMHKTVYTC